MKLFYILIYDRSVQRFWTDKNNWCILKGEPVGTGYQSDWMTGPTVRQWASRGLELVHPYSQENCAAIVKDISTTMSHFLWCLTALQWHDEKLIWLKIKKIWTHQLLPRISILHFYFSNSSHGVSKWCFNLCQCYWSFSFCNFFSI